MSFGEAESTAIKFCRFDRRDSVLSNLFGLVSTVSSPIKTAEFDDYGSGLPKCMGLVDLEPLYQSA